ncbi:vexin [Cynocephalus volans]|uniref:vexin n=1 Tax=Cynocephalus volans TaxID=110931 RepID=UPI002FC58293
MHQIYSCSDENIEVFTTVIPSKVSSPARRRVKSAQHLLTKNVVIESDLYTHRPLELLQHRSDRRDVGDSLRFSRLQSARPPGAHPAKNPARPGGISEPKASNLCGNRAYGKSLIPPVPRILVKAPVTTVEVAAPGSERGAVLTRGSRHLKKMAEEYPALPQGAEASLPLTGSASCGVPNILRKMWTRHKKKSEYVGATNSAFEAD